MPHLENGITVVITVVLWWFWWLNEEMYGKSHPLAWHMVITQQMSVAWTTQTQSWLWPCYQLQEKQKPRFPETEHGCSTQNCHLFAFQTLSACWVQLRLSYSCIQKPKGMWVKIYTPFFGCFLLSVSDWINWLVTTLWDPVLNWGQTKEVVE